MDEEGKSGDDLFSRLLPGLIVMFVMFSVTLAAQALVEDRRTGTLERLMTTRLGVNQLFAGKLLSGVMRAMFQTVVMLSLAFVVFRAGGPLAYVELLAFALLAAAAFTGVSLVIGAVARNRNQAAWAAVFFTLLMVVFSGTFFQITEGTLMHSISRATINAYAIDAMQNILGKGEHLGQQWLEMAVMAGVAVVGLAVARLLFRITPGGKVATNEHHSASGPAAGLQGYPDILPGPGSLDLRLPPAIHLRHRVLPGLRTWDRKTRTCASPSRRRSRLVSASRPLRQSPLASTRSQRWTTTRR